MPPVDVPKLSTTATTPQASRRGRVPAVVSAPVAPTPDRLTLSDAKAPAPATAKDVTPSQAPVSWKVRATAMGSFFSNMMTGWLLDPTLLMAHLKGTFTQGYRLAKGTQNATVWAKGVKSAHAEGRTATFLKDGLARVGGRIGRGVTALKGKLAALVSGKPIFSTSIAETAAPAAAAAAKNKGLLGFYGLARAEGVAPVKAAGSAFVRVVQTGGDMPQVAAHAATLGGRWGQAFLWAGKLARLAPLMNVPLAAIDLWNLRKVLNNPNATQRERNAKIGQAILSTVAGGFSLAAFVVPAPFDVLALRVASTAGLGSLAWALCTSRPVVKAYNAVKGFFTR